MVGWWLGVSGSFLGVSGKAHLCLKSRAEHHGTRLLGHKKQASGLNKLNGPGHSLVFRKALIDKNKKRAHEKLNGPRRFAFRSVRGLPGRVREGTFEASGLKKLNGPRHSLVFC